MEYENDKKSYFLQKNPENPDQHYDPKYLIINLPAPYIVTRELQNELGKLMEYEFW